MSDFRLYTLHDAECIIAANLHKLRQFDTIIGVPRSGTIFAAFIATQLGVSLADVSTASRELRVAKHGYTRWGIGDFGKCLLVEDVVNQGKSTAQAFEVLKITTGGVLSRENVTTCSIWTNPKSAPNAVDINLGGPHSERYGFSWQVWHSALWPQWATDMDGVLCHDVPTHVETEEHYQKWAGQPTGKWLPRPKNKNKWPVGAVITSRPEGVRQQTQNWLRAQSVYYNNLVMAPGATQEDVNKNLKQMGLKRGHWKAKMAEQLGLKEFFIESCPKQSQQISERFPGLVWCTDTQQRYRHGQEVPK